MGPDTEKPSLNFPDCLNHCFKNKESKKEQKGPSLIVILSIHIEGYKLKKENLNGPQFGNHCFKHDYQHQQNMAYLCTNIDS